MLPSESSRTFLKQVMTLEGLVCRPDILGITFSSLLASHAKAWVLYSLNPNIIDKVNLAGNYRDE